MLSIGLHLRMIGRPARIGGLETILRHMHERGGAWIARRDAIARHWLANVEARAPRHANPPTHKPEHHRRHDRADGRRRGALSAGRSGDRGADRGRTASRSSPPARPTRPPRPRRSRLYAAQHRGAHDAVIIGCFGDPGLEALRAAARAPVLGLAESSIREADALGEPFAILTMGKAWVDILNERVALAELRTPFRRRVRGRRHGPRRQPPGSLGRGRAGSARRASRRGWRAHPHPWRRSLRGFGQPFWSEGALHRLRRGDDPGRAEADARCSSRPLRAMRLGAHPSTKSLRANPCA